MQIIRKNYAKLAKISHNDDKYRVFLIVSDKLADSKLDNSFAQTYLLLTQ